MSHQDYSIGQFLSIVYRYRNKVNIHIIKELLHEMAHNACHIEKQEQEVQNEENTL